MRNDEKFEREKPKTTLYWIVDAESILSFNNVNQKMRNIVVLFVTWSILCGNLKRFSKDSLKRNGKPRRED